MSHNGHAAIELALHTGQGHHGWIGYRIRALVTMGEEMQEFISPVGPLFFDDRIEPEVPKLLWGLSNVVRGAQEVFRFEPIDEGDFCLELCKKSPLIAVTLFMDHALVVERSHVVGTSVGLQVLVTTTELVAFVDSLKSQYDRVQK